MGQADHAGAKGRPRRDKAEPSALRLPKSLPVIEREIAELFVAYKDGNEVQ
jgi:hypothetical protein